MIQRVLFCFRNLKSSTRHLFMFQVRVRVIEGRQLAGANISPVVRVTIGNQTRQTKVVKSTNKPFYDEVFDTRLSTTFRQVV